MVKQCATFPSPLAGEGLGVRGLRRKARFLVALPRRTLHPAAIARPEGRASFRTPYGATFSRKGRRER
jgi:hypothetical protein